MFKSVTKLANSFKALVYPPTPKRKVLVSFVPVKSVENAAAIRAGRQEVLATLKKVLAKKQAELDAAIDEGQVALHDRMFNGLHTECLLEILHKLNFHDADNFNEKELDAFTAAVDFYGGIDDTRLFMKAIVDAAKVINRGEYAYFDEDVTTYESLGVAVFDSVIENYCVPAWLEDYIDYERLGEDFADYNDGDFTRCGFFAPERTWA